MLTAQGVSTEGMGIFIIHKQHFEDLSLKNQMHSWFLFVSKRMQYCINTGLYKASVLRHHNDDFRRNAVGCYYEYYFPQGAKGGR